MDHHSHTDFYWGELDEEMVEDYLNLRDPVAKYYTTTARLITMSDDTQAYSEAVGELAKQDYEKTCSNLLISRKALALAMTRPTLLITAAKLGIHLPDIGKNDALLKDPMKGPILQAIRENLHLSKEEYENAITCRLSVELATAGLYNDKLPKIPCNLKNALSFLIGNQQVKWDALELAFLEWLIVKTSPDNEFYEKFEETLLKNRLNEFKNLSKRHPLNKRFAREVKVCKKELTNLSEVRQIRSDFYPGTVINNSVLKRRAKLAYKQSWSNKKCVGNREFLDLLVSDFRGFWTTHSVEYKKLAPDYVKKSQAASDHGRSAGNTGVHTREHSKWLDRTNDLIAHIGRGDLPKDPENIKNLLTSFAQAHRGLLSPKPKEANLQFFQALIAQLPKKPSDPVVRNILSVLRPGNSDLDDLQNRKAIKQSAKNRNTEDFNKAGRKNLFKSMTKEIIRDCYTLLEDFARRQTRR